MLTSKRKSASVIKEGTMELSPFQLERYFARYEFNARYLLCSSDCESLTIADLLAYEPGADEDFSRHWLGYTESTGAPSLRREITRLYPGLAPEQVLVHSGAEEAIFLFMHAALQPGDHVIVHWPCYQSLFEVAQSIGAEVTFWRAHEEKGWTLDLDELKAALRPNTRAIVINTPHNPTGYLMSAADYAALNQLASEKGIVLFSDEVYRESEYVGTDRLPSACQINPLAVSLGVVSKTYGLPGLRIGWVATQNQKVLEHMAALKDYTSICNSAPSEFLAELALRHREALAARNQGIIQHNLGLLDAFFARYADRFQWVRPIAGPIAYPRLLKGDIEAFCHQLVTEEGVLLLPGTLYGDSSNHFRMGFGRKNLPEALAHLQMFLERV
jgi:aspartate/methionine/tyrosine aminotransferase